MIETSGVFKFNSSHWEASIKSQERKRKQSSKNSNSKSKNPSITRSSIKQTNKINSPYSKIKITKEKLIRSRVQIKQQEILQELQERKSKTVKLMSGNHDFPHQKYQDGLI